MLSYPLWASPESARPRSSRDVENRKKPGNQEIREYRELDLSLVVSGGVAARTNKETLP
jgi:hypothetical protein